MSKDLGMNPNNNHNKTTDIMSELQVEKNTTPLKCEGLRARVDKGIKVKIDSKFKKWEEEKSKSGLKRTKGSIDDG